MEPAGAFWEAEPEHQDYLQKYPGATRATSCAPAGCCRAARRRRRDGCGGHRGHRPRREWAGWHAEREEVLRAPHGWLSLTGLHWLDGRPGPVPGPAGHLAGARGRRRHHGAGRGRRRRRRPRGRGDRPRRPVDGKPGVLVAVGERRVEVIRRERASRAAGPRSAGADPPARSPACRVPRRRVVDRHRALRGVRTPRSASTSTPSSTAWASTRRPSAPCASPSAAPSRLIALAGRESGPQAPLPRRDVRHTTYGGGRILRTADPAADGTVRIDLNRTTNLPCAFSAFATCPLPPAGNVVTVPVEAGEKTPA